MCCLAVIVLTLEHLRGRYYKSTTRHFFDKEVFIHELVIPCNVAFCAEHL
jgi:hypothetical protein